MIISEINGGLGNQMFQYACGRAKALQLDTALRLDISTLQKGFTDKHFTARPYELGIFAANALIANAQELARFSPKSIPLKVWYKWIKSYRNYTEPFFYYDSKLSSLNGNIFLRGYWQSEKYFEAFEKQIKNDFEFIKPINNLTSQLEKEIGLVNAISVHVRRGDYVSSPTANSFHGVAGLSYYYEAMQQMEVLVDKPVFYLFSDDSAWVKAHLVKDRRDVIVVEHNSGNDSWQDMLLMSKCKHHIIANSSFSWWGAWLNRNVQKVVIAPNQWFANKAKNDETQDLIPTRWIRL
jgi:Glycosyl transferase family 11